MSIVIFLAILLVLVLAHEFGHFIVAKKFGIRVDEFAFGFPPKLFSIKKGETTYAFNALPLGGYVKIYGENPDDVHAGGADSERSFTAKPHIVQAAVILAGVVFNIILAWLIISSVLIIGTLASADDAIVPLQDVHLMVSDVREGAPAARAGLRSGDVVLALEENGMILANPSSEQVITFISTRANKEIYLTYQRAKETLTTTVTPESGIIPDAPAIGIYMDNVGTLKLSPPRALWEGGKRTWLYTKLTAQGIWGFLSSAVVGRADLTQVTGPVGIVKAVGSAAELGLTSLLMFTALISLNLAVINVIPFPALDGGRLLFIILEAILRRPISAKVQNIFNVVGFALLMLLMLVVTYHDVSKIL